MVQIRKREKEKIAQSLHFRPIFGDDDFLGKMMGGSSLFVIGKL